MEINTKSEQQPISRDKIIHFPEGILGFESLKDYNILSSETEKDLHWLRSVDDENIEFAITDPTIFQVDYEIALNDVEAGLLEASEDSEILVLIILYKNDHESESSGIKGNFTAPVLINADTNKGMQKILNNTRGSMTIKSS